MAPKIMSPSPIFIFSFRLIYLIICLTYLFLCLVGIVSLTDLKLNFCIYSHTPFFFYACPSQKMVQAKNLGSWFKSKPTFLSLILSFNLPSS